MLNLSLQIENGPETTAANLNQSLTEALKTAVRSWHKVAAPLHFKTGAARKYGYKTRSRRYQKEKNRKGLGPLTYSGRAKRQLLQHIKPTGSKGLVKGKFVTDASIKYFWMTGGKHPNKGAELVATQRQEVKKLQQLIETQTSKNIAAVKGEKKRIGPGGII